MLVRKFTNAIVAIVVSSAKTLTRSNTKDKKTALDKDELFHRYMSFTFGMPI